MRCKYFFSAFFRAKRHFLPLIPGIFFLRALLAAPSCALPWWQAELAAPCGFHPLLVLECQCYFYSLGLYQCQGQYQWFPPTAHHNSLTKLQLSFFSINQPDSQNFSQALLAIFLVWIFDNIVLLSHHPLIFCVSQKPQLFNPWYWTHPLKKEEKTQRRAHFNP